MDWISIALGGLGGAILTLLGKIALDWWNRPKLFVDFEKKGKEYPRIHIINEDNLNTVLCLRLRVANKVNTTARDCEAKIEFFAPKCNEYYKKPLHWDRQDPLIYNSLDKIYAPITLNPNDEEFVDVLRLKYSPNNYENPIISKDIETYSPEVLLLQKNEEYFIKVTIYASNTTSKPFFFKVNWDGTIQGFHKASTRSNKFPKEKPVVRQVM